uniref:Uncharacterized protein n=1 Tax=Magallana gigas TaxID=29159 RepID=K1Q081_MAGGI
MNADVMLVVEMNKLFCLSVLLAVALGDDYYGAGYGGGFGIGLLGGKGFYGGGLFGGYGGGYGGYLGGYGGYGGLYGGYGKGFGGLMYKLICFSVVLAVAAADGYYDNGYGGGFGGKGVAGVGFLGGKGIYGGGLYGGNFFGGKGGYGKYLGVDTEVCSAGMETDMVVDTVELLQLSQEEKDFGVAK